LRAKKRGSDESGEGFLRNREKRFPRLRVDDFAKSRHPVEKRGPGILDTGVRRNDEIRRLVREEKSRANHALLFSSFEEKNGFRRGEGAGKA